MSDPLCTPEQWIFRVRSGATDRTAIVFHKSWFDAEHEACIILGLGRDDIELIKGPYVSTKESRSGRKRMPKRRVSEAFELRIGGPPGVKLFVTVGLYEDGRPGEIWLDMSKPGSDLRSFATGFAISVSMLLQYGAPVEEIVHAFEKLAGGPCGVVQGHEAVKEARSMIDAVAQLLMAEYGRK